MRRFWKYALFAALAAAFFAGCSEIADSGTESSKETGELKGISIQVPNYAYYAGSGARAIAPQSANVKLSSAASTPAFTVITKELSDGKPDYNEEGDVVATSYTISFKIPVGTYSAGSLKLELLDSSGNLLSSGSNTESITVTSSGGKGSFKLLPYIGDVDNTSGSLAAGEMKFIQVTVGASSSCTVTETGDVSLFKFDSTGKFEGALTLTDGTATITNNASSQATCYIGIYSAAEVSRYTVTVAAVAKQGGETLTWDFSTGAVTMYTDDALSEPDSDSIIQYSNGTATAYLKGSSSGSSAASMKVETPVSGAKIAIRNTSSNQDVQVNAGSVLYIPVSSGSVVTVTQRSAGDYELGGVESLTYTALADGYVVYDVISSHYLSRIVVTDVVVSDDHTSDAVQFIQKTDSSTANAKDVLGFTATDVSSSDESVATADLTSNSGYITITSKAAGTATITATGSGSETTSWTVTVRRYGNIVVGSITKYVVDDDTGTAFTIKYFDTSDTSNTAYAAAAAGATTGSDYVTLSTAATTYNSIYSNLSTSWSASAGATFALTNSSSYSSTSKADDILAVIFTITAKDYDVKLKSIDFTGSQTASGNNIYVDMRCNDTSFGATSTGNNYSVSAKAINQTITAGNSATVSIVFKLASGKTLNKAISPILKDVVINCSADTVSATPSADFTFTFLSGDSDISVSCKDNGSNSYTFTATPPLSSATYTYAWYIDLSEVLASSNSTLTTTISDSGKHAVLVTATDSETGVVYSAQYTLSVE